MPRVDRGEEQRTHYIHLIVVELTPVRTLESVRAKLREVGVRLDEEYPPVRTDQQGYRWLLRGMAHGDVWDAAEALPGVTLRPWSEEEVSDD